MLGSFASNEEFVCWCGAAAHRMAPATRLESTAAGGIRIHTAAPGPSRRGAGGGNTSRAAPSRLHTAAAPSHHQYHQSRLPTAAPHQSRQPMAADSHNSRLTTAAAPSRPPRTAVLTTAGSSLYEPTRLATAAASSGGLAPPPTAGTTFSVARGLQSGLAGLTQVGSKEMLRIKKRRLPSSNWWKSFGRPAPRIGVHGASVFGQPTGAPEEADGEEPEEREEEAPAELLVVRPRSRSAGTRQSAAEVRMQVIVLQTENALLRSKLETKQQALEEASSAAATAVDAALAEALKGDGDDNDELAADPEAAAAEAAARLQAEKMLEAARAAAANSVVAAVSARRGSAGGGGAAAGAGGAFGVEMIESAIEAAEAAASRVARWHEAAAAQRELLGLHGGGYEAADAMLRCTEEADDGDAALGAPETAAAAEAARLAAVDGAGAGASSLAAHASWLAYKDHRGKHAARAAAAAAKAATEAAVLGGATADAALLVAQAAALVAAWQAEAQTTESDQSGGESGDGSGGGGGSSGGGLEGIREMDATQLQTTVTAIGLEMVASGGAVGSGAVETIALAAIAATRTAARVTQLASERAEGGGRGGGGGGDGGGVGGGGGGGGGGGVGNEQIHPERYSVHPDAKQWAHTVSSRLAATGCSHAVCLLGARAFVSSALQSTETEMTMTAAPLAPTTPHVTLLPAHQTNDVRASPHASPISPAAALALPAVAPDAGASCAEMALHSGGGAAAATAAVTAVAAVAAATAVDARPWSVEMEADSAAEVLKKRARKAKEEAEAARAAQAEEEEKERSKALARTRAAADAPEAAVEDHRADETSLPLDGDQMVRAARASLPSDAGATQAAAAGIEQGEGKAQEWEAVAAAEAMIMTMADDFVDPKGTAAAIAVEAVAGDIEALTLEAALSALVAQLKGKQLEPRQSATPEQLRDEMRILDGMRATAAAAVAEAVRAARPGIRRAASIAASMGCDARGVSAAMRAVAYHAGQLAPKAGSSLALDAAAKAAAQASIDGHSANEASVAAAAAALAMAPGFMAGAMAAGKHAAIAMLTATAAGWWSTAGALRAEAMAAGAAAAEEYVNEASSEQSIRAAAAAAALASAAAAVPFLSTRPSNQLLPPSKLSGRARVDATKRLVSAAAAAAAEAIRDGHDSVEAQAAALAVVAQGLEGCDEKARAAAAAAAVSIRERFARAAAIARSSSASSAASSSSSSSSTAEPLAAVAREAIIRALGRGASPGMAAVACVGTTVREAAAAAAVAKLAELDGRPAEAAAAAAMVAARAMVEEASPAVAAEAASNAAAAVSEALAEVSAEGEGSAPGEMARSSGTGDGSSSGAGGAPPSSSTADETAAARLAAAVARGVSKGGDTIAELEGPLSMPAWGLESWLGSLDFNKLLCDALLQRVRAKTGGTTDARQELAFVTQLGKGEGDRGAAVVEALMEESGVMQAVAREVFESARRLDEEMREAKEAEAKRRAAEREAKRKAIRARRRLKAAGAAARMAGGVLNARILAKMNEMDDAAQGGQGGGEEGEDDGGGGVGGGAATVEPAVLSAEQLNAQFASGGAITLFYSNDNELFWQGLNRVVGKCADGIEEPLLDVMKRENTAPRPHAPPPPQHCLLVEHTTPSH